MKDTEDTKIDVIAVGGISIDYIFKINKLPKKNMASLLLEHGTFYGCLLYTSPSPRDLSTSRMPSSA